MDSLRDIYKAILRNLDPARRVAPNDNTLNILRQICEALGIKWRTHDSLRDLWKKIAESIGTRITRSDSIYDILYKIAQRADTSPGEVALVYNGTPLTYEGVSIIFGPLLGGAVLNRHTPYPRLLKYIRDVLQPAPVDPFEPETQQAIARVQADGGVVEQPQLVNGLISTIKNAGVYSLWAGGWARGFGEKFRVSGPDRFVSKAYDLSPQQADLAQTIEGQQPIALTDTEWQFATDRNWLNNQYNGLRNADGYTIIQVAVDPLTQTAPAFTVDIFDAVNFLGTNRIVNAGKLTTTGVVAFQNRYGVRRIGADTARLLSPDVSAPIRACRVNFRTGNLLAEFLREKTVLTSRTDLTAGKTADVTGSFYFGRGFAEGSQSWNTTQRMTLIFRDAITGAAYDAIIDYLKQLYPDYITP